MTIKKDSLIKLIVVFLGLSIPIGEKLNSIFPGISLLYVYIGALLILVSLLIHTSRITVKFNSLLLLTLLILVSSIFSFNGSFTLTGMFEHFKTIVFILISSFLLLNFKFNRKLIDVFLSSFVSSYTAIYLFYLIISFNEISRFSSSYINPNAFAFDSLFVVFTSMYFIFSKKVKHRFLYFIPMVLSLSGILISGTRSAIIGLVVGVLVTPFVIKKVKTGVLFSIILIITTLVIVYQFDSPISERIARILYGDSISSSFRDNLRLDIWVDYLRNVNRYFWFGLNTDYWNLINERITHNTFLYIFVSYGVFALILYSWIITKVIHKYLVKTLFANRKSIYLAAGFIGILTMSLFLDVLNLRVFWTVLFLIIGLNSHDGELAIHGETCHER